MPIRASNPISITPPSPQAMAPAEGRVAELLAPFKDSLIHGTLEGYSLPVSDGSEQNRKNARRALKLLNEAGWRADDAGVLRDAQGKEFAFEILLQQGDTEIAPAVDIFVEGLKRLGIRPRLTTVDAAQYRERTNRFEFGMAWFKRALSLSPGNEQLLYWGAAGINTPGSRNWMGDELSRRRGDDRAYAGDAIGRRIHRLRQSAGPDLDRRALCHPQLVCEIFTTCLQGGTSLPRARSAIRGTGQASNRSLVERPRELNS